MKAWYLIQSKPQQEQIAQEQLERQDYEIYLPLASMQRRKRGKTIRVIAPMFPRYLFINLSDKTDDWRPIRSTIGVSSLVRFGMQPAKVPDNLIDTLRKREDETGVQILPTKKYKIGEKVRVSEGPFEGYEAVIHAKSAKERVVLLMKVIEKFVKVELDTEHLEHM